MIRLDRLRALEGLGRSADDIVIAPAVHLIRARLEDRDPTITVEEVSEVDIPEKAKG